MREDHPISLLGWLGGVLALGLFAIAVFTGSSQLQFQINRPATEYAALLVQRAPILRADLGLDFLFIAVYSTFFVVLSRRLDVWHRGPTGPHGVWLGALLLTGLLDAAENAHILAMLSLAQYGLPLSQTGIAVQMAASQLKFMASYFGLFLLSFALPSDTWLERALVILLRWIQLPVGVAILVLPPESARPLYFVRVGSFVAGFWAIAWIARGREAASRV